ncbi:MAG: hypothetical protein HUJ30_00140, partial [Gammaproteobacteria bacterium]|nr:hypothetical protein [Gammaproteobacteria bacterium]
IGWHKADTEKTVMAALLAGVLISEQSDNSPQFGGAITYSRGRSEIDFSAFWRQGTGMMTDMKRYDLSWQYRLVPSVRPDWESVPEWYGVIELGARWMDEPSIPHQLTVGIQRLAGPLVLEGGVVMPVEGDADNQYIMSARYRF